MTGFEPLQPPMPPDPLSHSPRSGVSPQQVTVCACSLETDVGVIFREFIDGQPVGFDVAITAACKISAQRVILS
jgi:hypothetical protein